MSIFDVNSDAELFSLLTSIAQHDKMVMSAIFDELEDAYSHYEMGFYSALESDYQEPRGYKSMLKRPPEERERNGLKDA